MKSYFAKLATRVTLAHPQVSLPVAAPKSVAPITAATNHVEQYGRPRHRANQTDDPRPPSRSEEVASPAQLSASTRFAARNHAVERVEIAAKAEESPTPITLSPDTSKRTLHSETRIIDEDQTREPDRVWPQENSLTMLTPREVSDTQKEIEGEADSDRPTETDQSVLLRKMDAFMEPMLRRRSEPTAERDSERESEQPKAKSPAAPETTMRLQPLPRTSQVVEPAEEQTSLVIEKLTVEMVPPAPPPVQSQRQIVVMREARGERRVVPSSRRFGLSQF